LQAFNYFVSMINEIFPHRFDNRFVAAATIAEEDFVFIYNGNSLLLKSIGDGFELPRKKDVSGLVDTSEGTFLFALDQVRCFLVWDGPKTVDGRFVYKETGFFRTVKPPEIAWAGIVGFHLMTWYAQNRFCGKCGSRTREKPGERAILCPACTTTVFPKISPAIIVAILCKDKILLAHNAGFPQNWHSLLAGYVDIGESLEEAVVREIKEEAGLDVRNIRYYKSQPWPFSGSLMVGFVADADDTQPVRPDNIEITEAAWFTRGNLPNHPPGISIAGEMIDKFEKGEL
jgi:NAD+ diphosphatase